MSVIVTGASGFLGRHLIAHELGAGREVIAMTRDAKRLDDLRHPRLRVVEGTIPAESAETVIHLAAQRNMPTRNAASFHAPNVELARNVARAAKGRFVYVSTALALAGNDVPSAYIATRKEALDAVGSDAAIVLPSIIFGPDHPRAQNRITSHIRGLLRGPIRIGLGGKQEPRNMVYVHDVVRAILQAPIGRTLVSGENVTQERLERETYAAAGRRPAPRVVLPRFAALAAAKTIDAILGYDRTSGWTSRLETLLAPWCFEASKDATPFAEGVRRTVAALQTDRGGTEDWIRVQ